MPSAAYHTAVMGSVTGSHAKIRSGARAGMRAESSRCQGDMAAHHPDVAVGADLAVQLYEQLVDAGAPERAHQPHRLRPRHAPLLCPAPDPGLRSPAGTHTKSVLQELRRVGKLQNPLYGYLNCRGPGGTSVW